MKFKHIHFIINPASGKEEPILSYINQAFSGSSINWDVAITKKDLDAGTIARKLIGKTDLVAVYGGDGCVTAVAATLHGTKLPVAIIPGGTANVMAKELGIPLDTIEALQLLKNGKHRIKAIDMGLVNNKPFLLRINLGIMADMIIQADRKLKDSIGQLAYGVTAIKTAAEAEPVSYQLVIDGQKIIKKGVALTVTNSGSMGIGNFNLQPGISVTDGFLDIILMKDNDLLSLIKMAGSALLQNESAVVEHWKCRKVNISLTKKQAFIVDDTEYMAKNLKIEIVPGSIQMLVPTKQK